MADSDILSVMEDYRQSSLSRLTSWCLWIWHLLLHPTNAWRSSTLWNKVHLFFCYILSCISVGHHEKNTLLEWVRTRVKNHPVPDNFSSGWKDGILLCALLDSMYPGSCPRYDLLNPDNCLSNAELAFFLLEKHTPIRPEITAEELAEGSQCIEKAVRAIVSHLKQISAKTQLQRALGKRPSIKEDTDDSNSLVAKQNCFAKGMGLILAVRGRKATFNIFTRSTCNFCIVVEIKGPDNSICKEIITNKSPRRKVTKSTEDRDNSADEDQLDKKILIEYDIQPGKVAVKYTPVLKGKHQLSVIWHGQHLAGSPFTVNVDDSTDYAEEAMLMRQDSTESQGSEKDDKPSVASAPTLPGQIKGRVKRRRVLRRILNVNGQDIVIEGDDPGKLQQVLQSISKNAFRQNNGDSCQKRAATTPDIGHFRPHFSPFSSPESSPETYSRNDFGSKSMWDASRSPSKLATPEIVVSSFGQTMSDEETFERQNDAKAEPLGSGLQCSTETTCELALKIQPCIKVEEPCVFEVPHREDAPTLDKCPGVDTNVESEPAQSTPCSISPEDQTPACQSICSELPQSELQDNTGCLDSIHLADDSSLIDSSLVSPELSAIEEARKLCRALSIISEESDKGPLDPTELHDIAESSSGEAREMLQDIESMEQINQKSSIQPLQEALPSKERLPCKVISNLNAFSPVVPKSVLPKTGSAVTVEANTKPEQAAESKIEALYLDSLRLRQFFADKLKNRSQAGSSTEVSFIGEREDFIPVKDRVKDWEEKHSPDSSRNAERAAAFVRSDSVEAVRPVPRSREHIVNLVKNSTPPEDSSVDSDTRPSDDRGLSAFGGHENPPRSQQRHRRRGMYHSPAQFPTPTSPHQDADNRSVCSQGHASHPGTLDSGLGTRDSVNSEDHSWRTNSDSSPTRAEGSEHRKYCHQSHSYAFWFGDIGQGPRAMRCQCSEGNLRRHVSMATVMSGDELSSGGQSSESEDNSSDSEYIDDLPNEGSLLLDCYPAFESVKLSSDVVGQIYYDENDSDLFGKWSSRPEKCVASGPRLYFGQVGAENHFEVSTKDAGSGPLSVSIQGPMHGSVIKVSVTYCGLDNYTVMYKVIEPGYYIVNIKWADWPIPDSPVMCKVTM
ncbi:uncharacterized protein LOC8039013 isoform X3 [Ixodes scapularis]|uniref:uncharacterized protein LOC8039013 isoform X3 n=1 Tax=Ixodes scapularis TaxID=6945 RepID=UPI001A9F18D5|nr:uncharacterized protein LOC8039013 isoform X3 [Ixodes scapularis]